MAKAKQNGTMTKADHIRAYLGSNPKAKTRQVVEGLAEQGVTVSANHVYLIRSKGKAKIRRSRRERIQAAAAGRPGIKNHADAVLQVKILARQLGGISSLKALVDAVAE